MLRAKSDPSVRRRSRPLAWSAPDGAVLEAGGCPAQNHIVVIPSRRAAGEDWLDACCWRCGSAEAALDSLGRRLCPPCLAELSDARATPPDDPLRVVRGAYWDAHVLERCWRCLTESVDPAHEVGLCPACVASLSVEDEAGSGEVTGR